MRPTDESKPKIDFHAQLPWLRVDADYDDWPVEKMRKRLLTLAKGYGAPDGSALIINHIVWASMALRGDKVTMGQEMKLRGEIKSGLVDMGLWPKSIRRHAKGRKKPEAPKATKAESSLQDEIASAFNGSQ